MQDRRIQADVTPRAGVWIETLLFLRHGLLAVSLPVRECGLKPSLQHIQQFLPARHSPCGSVD